MGPPIAERRPSEPREQDGVVDPYAWLRNRDDPAVVAYLEAENEHTEAATAHLAPLRDQLFQEIKSRVQETDLSVPTRRGDWWYYGRTEEGLQYPILCRKPLTVRTEREPAEGAVEQVVLDMNLEAGDSEYFSLGAYTVSPSGELLAWSCDLDGDEVFTIRVRDLRSGEDGSEEIAGVTYGAAWSADERHVFYTTTDESKRPYRLWRHERGTDPSKDVLLFQEDDVRFFLGADTTRDHRFLIMGLGSTLTSEVWFLDTENPTGELQCVRPRQEGVDYAVDHHSGTFFITTNEGDRANFAVMRASVSDPAHWTEVIPHDEHVRILGVDCFAEHAVVWQRRGGLMGARIHGLVDADGTSLGPGQDLPAAEPIYTIEPGSNPEFHTDFVRYQYTSLVTPASVMDYTVATQESELRKQQPVLGGYDPADYEQARAWATAADGEQIPISLVWKRDTGAGQRDGTAPLVLYGYGSYEISIDPWFSTARLSLLDRGFVFAIAHIRGGGEMGRLWYESGKFLDKMVTFDDFIACAEHVIADGWTAAEKLVIRGGSAGGMLMGVVINKRPDLYGAVVAEVPFVDCLNTMLDASIPLTTNEYEEWGNPEDAAYFDAIRSYAPYENVADDASGYPTMLVTAGLNDPRVHYWEPAKWVAKLRANGAGRDHPLLLKTKMGAGHSGPSGRYDAWHDEAFVMAFILDALTPNPST